MAQTQEKTMPSQQEALSILQQFIADEDADLAGRGGGSFWPSNWHRITPLEGKAETLLDAATHERFCLHYLRRTHVPPTLSEAALPRLLDAYRQWLPHAQQGDGGAKPHALVFLFGFDTHGALPGALKDLKTLQARRKLLTHLGNFSHLPGMRAKPKGFQPFLPLAEHILQVLQHTAYRQDYADIDDAYHQFTELRFWGMVYIVLMSPALRETLLADLMNGHPDLPRRDEVLGVLHEFVQAVLPSCGAEETGFLALAKKLGAQQRGRAAETESAALAKHLQLPFGEDEAWNIAINAPLRGRDRWYSPPYMHLAFQPDPDFDWRLLIDTGTHRYSIDNGKTLQNDGKLPPLAKLADVPQWLAQIKTSHGLDFDFDQGRIACGRKRAMAKTLRQWIDSGA
jgi:hypothetical protein